MNIKEMSYSQIENLYRGIVDETIFDHFFHEEFNEVFVGGYMNSSDAVDGNYYMEVLDTHYPNLDYIYSEDIEVIFDEFSQNYDDIDDIERLDYDFFRIVNNNLYFAIRG